MEQLTLSGEFTELPLEIAKLERLQRLELIWCWGLRRLPDEVLCIPSLREIGLGDNGLPRVYNQRQINTWLAGLHPWRRSRRSGIST